MSNRVLRSALRYQEQRRPEQQHDLVQEDINIQDPRNNVEVNDVQEEDVINANDENINIGVLFPNQHIVYQNDDFKLVIKKSAFVKQKNFALSDHLYLMELIMNDDTAPKPLISSILYALRLGIETILKKLKRFYARIDGKQHQVYLTIHEDSIKGGLNTGIK
jgi:hypothetical protein